MRSPVSPTFSEMTEHYEIEEHEVTAEGRYTIKKAKKEHSDYDGILPRNHGNYDEGKDWRLIRGTTQEVWQLHSVCQGGHIHAKCEGGERTRAFALYPSAMCKRVVHVLKKIHNQKGGMPRRHVWMASQENPAAIDPEVLKKETEQDLMRWSTELLRLHKLLGHPSSQAFVKMLRDRGANSTIVTLASQLHCMDCQEASIPPSRRVTTLETSTELWEVVQVDNMEITIGGWTYHFQLMVDEASSHGVVSFLFAHQASDSRNATSEEIIDSLQKHWIQYFGYAKKFKYDQEGAHRGRLFTEWGESVAIEMEAIPAEAHGHTGKVERLIGDITIPAPKDEKEWKAIVKEPSKFVAKKMAKGVEVS